MDNRADQKDPMMEIFMDECADLVSQYETYLSMAADRNEYTMDIINEIFRITHTIKADATMMLFECIAVPMRSFERVLYFYRDEKSNVNFDEFTDMLNRLIVFVEDEIDAILKNEASEHDGEMLSLEFRQYRDKLAGSLTVENVEHIENTARAERNNEPMRFYIGSSTESSPEQKPEKEIAHLREKVERDIAAALESKQHEKHADVPVISTVETEKKTAAEGQTAEPAASDENAPKEKPAKRIKFDADEEDAPKSMEEYRWLKEKNSITMDELQRLYDMIKGLNSLEAQIMKRFGYDYDNFADLLSEFHELNISMLDWVTNAATMPMGHLSPKLNRTVKEMNSRMGRNVTIDIEGEDVLVDKDWIDKLSGVLVHMIRNAIDHGIETRERRIQSGKEPEGTVKITYATEFGEFVMSVSDDGRGINCAKLKNNAIDRGIIFGDEDLPDEEIMKLIFLPGVTTNDHEGVYSGRGVGMDVVHHNIEEIGGRIDIDSREGIGTTFWIRIPLNPLSSGEEAGDDEDFDSRR